MKNLNLFIVKGGMIKLLPLFLFLMLSSLNASELEKYCYQYGGEVVSSYTCPKSKLKLPFDFCVYKNKEGITQFFDGCTGPKNEFTKYFYPHCIAHDLCYHHEPVSSGLSQKDCDTKFKKGMLQECEGVKNSKKCKTWAKTMYSAVRALGKLAFHCADYKADY